MRKAVDLEVEGADIIGTFGGKILTRMRSFFAQ
jgi:hypothetical protein